MEKTASPASAGGAPDDDERRKKLWRLIYKIGGIALRVISIGVAVCGLLNGDGPA